MLKEASKEQRVVSRKGKGREGLLLLLLTCSQCSDEESSSQWCGEWSLSSRGSDNGVGGRRSVGIMGDCVK